MKNPFLYDLTKSKPAVKKPGGTVQLAYETDFPVVAGQNAAMALVVLKKGGIREPHWHPDAWEFDYCISGKARMSVVGPNDEWQSFKVEPGQIVFVPQGYFHYFENIGEEDLRFLIVFNNQHQGEQRRYRRLRVFGRNAKPRPGRDIWSAGIRLRADPQAAQGGHHHAEAIAARTIGVEHTARPASHS
jgi:oxalate decarboxylase/phosphoglucose isomerase-like protein (cupin superfamily)